MLDLWTIPASWQWSTLECVAQWASGGTPKATEKRYYENGNIPWLIIGDLNDGLVASSAKKITEIGLANSSAKWVKRGSVLIAMYGSIGKLGIAGIDCTTNQAIAFTDDFSGLVEPKLLFYYLRSIRSNLLSIGKGGAQQNISQTVLKQVEIPIPPLNEQKRIVAKLDELLPKVEACKQRLEKIPTILKRFRQSVLADAVYGKLTEEWRSNFPNSETATPNISDFLVDDTKVKKRDRIEDLEWRDFDDIPSTWKMAKLWQVCKKITDGTHDTPKVTEEGVPYITAQHVRDGKISFHECLYLSQQDHREIFARCNPEKGDVLVVNIGAGTGTSSLVNVDFEFSLKNVALLKPNGNLLNGNYLELYMRAVGGYVLSQISRGGAQPFLSLRVLKSIPIPIPPLEEQKEIVRISNYYLNLELHILERCKTSLRYVHRMSEVILKKAFSGNLAEQDPNDEPASLTLERIKSSASTPKQKKAPSGKIKAAKVPQSLSA